jgi:hypothetical protein
MYQSASNVPQALPARRTVSIAAAVMMVSVVASCGLQEHPRAGAGADPGIGGDPFGGLGGQGAGSGTGGAAAGTGGRGGSGSGGAGRPDGGSNPATGGATGTGGAGMPPAPSGPGLMLGGQFVPKDKAIVVLHFGHSNMTGVARSPAEARAYHYEPQPRLWMYMGGTTFLPAKEQTAPSPGHNGAGPGFAILRSMAAMAPPDVHFISVGKGRGSATTADYQKGGLYYANGFMERAIALKGRVTFGSLWIMLGITDRHMPVPEQSGFADRLAKIVADIRADLGEPNLPVLHTDYEVESTGNLGINSEYALRIRPLILSLKDEVPRLLIIPTDQLGMHDDHHFDFNGQRVWAERGVKLLADNRWFPWGQ